MPYCRGIIEIDVPGDDSMRVLQWGNVASESEQGRARHKSSTRVTVIFDSHYSTTPHYHHPHSRNAHQGKSMLLKLKAYFSHSPSDTCSRVPHRHLQAKRQV